MVFAGAFVALEVSAFLNRSAAILVVAAGNSDRSRKHIQNSEYADHFCEALAGAIVGVATIPLADRPGCAG